MIVFVPRGDITGEDRTRQPDVYEGIANWLIECGATPINDA